MRRIWGVLGGKDDLLQLDPTLLAGTAGTGLKTVVRIIELFLVASQASAEQLRLNALRPLVESVLEDRFSVVPRGPALLVEVPLKCPVLRCLARGVAWLRLIAQICRLRSRKLRHSISQVGSEEGVWLVNVG